MFEIRLKSSVFTVFRLAKIFHDNSNSNHSPSFLQKTAEVEIRQEIDVKIHQIRFSFIAFAIARLRELT